MTDLNKILQEKKSYLNSLQEQEVESVDEIKLIKHTIELLQQAVKDGLSHSDLLKVLRTSTNNETSSQVRIDSVGRDIDDSLIAGGDIQFIIQILDSDRGLAEAENKLASEKKLPRIFVVHQVLTSEDEQFVKQIQQELESEGFDIVIKQKEQKITIQTQRELFVELGTCHGAVILFSKQAIEESRWFHLIVSLLRWRQWLDEDFRLIMVCLEGMTTAYLKENQWAPLALSTKHFLSSTSSEPIYIQAKSEFQYLVGRLLKRTHVEKLEDIIVSYLEDIPRTSLENAMREIGEYMADREADLSIKRQLARQLLRYGFDAFFKFVKEARPPTKPAEKILDILAPSWVDLRAAGLLAKAKSQQDAVKGFYIQAGLPPFTSKMYVRQACCEGQGPKFWWQIIEVTAEGGEDTLGYVLAEIREKFRQQRPLLQNYSDMKIDERINQLIERDKQRQGPTFVLLPPQFIEDKELLNSLMRIYPSLTFLFVTPEKFEILPENIELVEPPLVLEEEEYAYDYFYRLQKLLS